MKKKAASGITLTLLLIGITLAFNIQPVKATGGTIYIRADGSVDPAEAPIQRDGDLYTFTDNIYEEIRVERDNVVVDGADYVIQGTGAYPSKGIASWNRQNITIMNVEIKAFYIGIGFYWSSNNTIFRNNITANIIWGIDLYYSSNNSISENNIVADETCQSGNVGMHLQGSSNNNIAGNNITNTDIGIYLYYSSKSSIYGNCITANDWYGLALDYSSNNNIVGNNITNNANGIIFSESSNNTIYHNNFIDNTRQVFNWPFGTPSINTWDDGYPSGGNYWSDYTSVDEKNGPNQDKQGSDGIGDTHYVIDANNQDRYPFMNPWTPFPKTIGQLKTTIEELWSQGKIYNQGVVKSLTAKLNVAKSLTDMGRINQAKTVLEAFVTQVQRLSEVLIEKEAAELLLKSAKYILTTL